VILYCSELTKEYRALVRQCRDLEREVKSELHRLSESRHSAGIRLHFFHFVVRILCNVQLQLLACGFRVCIS
jgi:hypothetical protein